MLCFVIQLLPALEHCGSLHNVIQCTCIIVSWLFRSSVVMCELQNSFSSGTQSVWMSQTGIGGSADWQDRVHFACMWYWVWDWSSVLWELVQLTKRTVPSWPLTLTCQCTCSLIPRVYIYTFLSVHLFCGRTSAVLHTKMLYYIWYFAMVIP